MLQMDQIDWLVVPVRECPTAEDEGRLINRHFRKPHEPWSPNRAFVLPVTIRRSRRRVLFAQRSGLDASIYNESPAAG
jgi:hypothetical protein